MLKTDSRLKTEERRKSPWLWETVGSVVLGYLQMPRDALIAVLNVGTRVTSAASQSVK